MTIHDFWTERSQLRQGRPLPSAFTPFYGPPPFYAPVSDRRIRRLAKAGLWVDTRIL